MYALDAADDSFDVVHAHQVLQHLTDPVAALREMARVCRPGGVVAVRDVDYAAHDLVPGGPRPRPLARPLPPGRPRATMPSPTPGDGSLSWAHAAGLRDTVATASTYCYASPEERRWWGPRGPGRATASSFAEQAVAYGLATTAELEEIAAAWLRWSAADDGWLGMLHGELLIRVLTDALGCALTPRPGPGTARQRTVMPAVSPGGRRWPGWPCSRTAPARAPSPRRWP